MKKLLYLLFLLPLGFMFSCSDDDDLPDVDITLTLDNAVSYEGEIYIVAGEPLNIQGITVQSLTDKAAAISAVTYSLDYRGMAYTNVAPFGVEISDMYLPEGNHLLQLNFDILQVDKSIAYASLQKVVRVVASEDELPEGTTLGTISLNYRLDPDDD